MVEATLGEYNRATSTAGADKRHLPGKRVSTVEWTLRGKQIAFKMEMLKRGKVVSTTYMVDPEYKDK